MLYLLVFITTLTAFSLTLKANVCSFAQGLKIIRKNSQANLDFKICLNVVFCSDFLGTGIQEERTADKKFFF